ncbi:hypothetical protein H5410_042208 [Solanum commersonii]|uniref:Uncharacterized protein n=1 Tax=Solanum commersonii TaxID=4109 RepID=A0A9J5XXU8_SOLCO|nr:hypothetical protein H5410_042208 [Solanum commersonii]
MDIRKTLVIEPVGPDGQIGPFSRSNKPKVGKPPFCQFFMYIVHRFLMIQNSDVIYAKKIYGHSLRTYPLISSSFRQLVLTGESIHFQGQRSPRTSIKTIVIKSVGPNGQTGPFSRSNEPQSRQTSLLPIFCMLYTMDFCFSWTFVKTLAIKRVNPTFANFCVLYSPWIFCNLKFQCDFCQNVSWTSVKTLAIELVGPEEQIGPFSRSNNPRAEFRHNFCRNISWTSIKALAIDQSRQANWPIFKVKRASEQINPTFCQFFVCYSSWIFGDTKFRRDFCQIFLFTFIKTLAISQLVPTGKPTHFQGRTIPRAGKPSFCLFFTLTIKSVGPDGQTDAFSSSNEPHSM